jgi:hypothetical protein
LSLSFSVPRSSFNAILFAKVTNKSRDTIRVLATFVCPFAGYHDKDDRWVEHVLTKLQKEKVDPIGLEFIYLGTHFGEGDWKRWDKIYANLDFKVNVDVTIQSIGGIR